MHYYNLKSYNNNLESHLIFLNGEKHKYKENALLQFKDISKLGETTI